MKKYYVFLLLLLLCVQVKCQHSENDANLEWIDHYLEEKSAFVHEKLHDGDQNFFQNRPHEIEITYNQTCDTRISNSTNAYVFSFFNTTYFLIGDKVLRGVFKQNSFTLQPHINLSYKGNFSYVQSTEFENMGFLLIGQNNSVSTLYTISSENKAFKSVQYIPTPYASDAHFFINNSTLYLVIVSNQGENMGVISIYKWLHSYFDEIKSTFTQRVTKVSSFRSGTSEIVLLLAQGPSNAEYLLVYNFKRDGIKKMQQIEIEKITHIDTVLLNNLQYVLIYTKERNNLVYLWNQMGLIYKNTFHTDFVVNNSAVVYSEAAALIIIPFSHGLMVYKPHSHGLRVMITKEYLTNYSVILDINKGGNENGNITFIVGLNEDNIVNINAMSFKVHPGIDNETENDVLKKCFYKLEENIYSEKRKLNSLLENKNNQTTSNVFKRHKRNLDAISLSTEADISDFLHLMQERLSKIKIFVTKEHETKNVMVINNSVIITGNVNLEKLDTTNLHVKKINNKNWVPEQWLRYQELQTVTGPVILKNVTTKVLSIPPTVDTFFRDFLLNKGNQTVIGQVTVENITALKVKTNQLNAVKIQDVYFKNSPVLIRGIKNFQNVEVEEAQIETLNKNKPDNILALFTDTISSNFVFDSNIKIENLWVSTIHDINWNDFQNSVYQIDQTDPINGQLIFSELKTEKLLAKTLNGVNTDTFFTISTDQNITSNIKFNRIIAENIEANRINDMSLESSVVLLNGNATITGPIKINNLNVENDLTLTGNVSESLLLKINGRIYGTNESDFLQIYKGKVTIKADLYVTNLSLSPHSKLIISENEFDINQYWTKSSVQEIPIHFEATNGMTVSHLNTTHFNSISIDHYMLTNKEPKEWTSYNFENVTVLGNVILNKSESHTPDLDKINSDSVKVNGVFDITGKKIFNNTLKIHNFITETVNDVDLSTVETGSSEVIHGTKFFQNIIVKENALSSNLSVVNINKINLENLRKNAIYTDRAQYIKKLDFKNVSITNLNVTKINGFDINAHIENMRKLYSDSQVSKIVIEGDVVLENVQNVNKINGIKIQPLLERVVSRKGSIGNRFKDDLKFLGRVTVNNLITKRVNDINLPELTAKVLYKKSNQTVFAPYTFKNLKTKSTFADQINDINISHLVDVSIDIAQEIFAPSGVTLTSPKFLKSISATKVLPCDIKKAMDNFQNPPTQLWSYIEIEGNATFLNEESAIYRIIEKTVKNNTDNIAFSSVSFTNNVSGENIMTLKHINKVNLEEILEDALFTNSDQEQVITGHNSFLQVEASEARVLENTDAPVVDKILIPNLYEMIILKDQIDDDVFIKGKKTFFAGLQTQNFYSKRISNMLPEDIVSLTNLSTIPLAVFDTLEIQNDLNAEKVNHFNISEILSNRLLTKGPEIQVTNATYFFEDLDIKHNFETTSINNINISDVVFDIGTQDIKSQKKFSENLEIFGNANIDYLNNMNITSSYQDAIINGDNIVINNSVRVLRPADLRGRITTHRINGYPVDNLKEILEKATTKAEEKNIFVIKKQIENIVKQTIPYVKRIPNEYMYIEKSEVLQIPVRNAVNAKVLQTKNYTLLYVFSEEPAEVCGLPEKCKCPAQSTIEITPKNSVIPYVNRGPERIYNYYDENMTIYLSTTSISTDAYCRTNRTEDSDELSSVAWISSKSSNNSLKFHPEFIKGYISGVEFFSLNGNTYVIIGRYYDPVEDTYDLDCTIMKISEDKTKLQQIQVIPTKGVTKLYIFHTAQGVTLIIGNKGSSYETSTTEIYRFNEDTERFQILRSVPYVCSDVSGVVLGFESLIILAYKNEPIQILKYNKYFDNYYYYQNFEFENAVIGISVFYTGDFGISDAYLCVVTANEYFYMYTFQFMDGWKLESEGSLEGLRNLIPFESNKELYLFTPSYQSSLVLTVVKHGST